VKEIKAMELAKGNVFEAGAGLDGVYELEVENTEVDGGITFVKTCEIDWPLAIFSGAKVRVVNL
jgi:hypothetical protein